MLAAVTDPNVWRFRAHPEVWVLVASLVGCYVYAVRAIGPRFVGRGQRAVTGKQIVCFAAGITLLWAASDWPIHDIGENNLYSVHMLQHMILSYFAPPLLLLAMPEWLMRLIVGDGKVYAAVRWLTKPVTAAVIFNLVIMVVHIPTLVNSAVSNGPLHYSLHLVLVLASLLMWMPVCGPLPEVRIGPGAKILYLFAQSFVPTVPAAWLIFADGVVYKAYDHLPRVFGISVVDDQQIAGLLMKIGGSVFLWTLCTVLFFNRFMRNWEQENAYGRRRIPDVEIIGHDEEPLTYDQVEEEFERVPPAPEPPSASM